ncbi:MAG: Nitrate reductase [Firmicutes bacterium]|nr:Nitrate reductase [Bacillota bacterium]
MTTFPSVCPYDCPDACGLLVTTDGKQVTEVHGDPSHPFTQGKLCAKMNHYERTVHSPKRLTTPLLRSGPKGTNAFTPISWEEALDRIAERWQTIIAEDGPEAILPCSYAGTMGLIQRNAGHAFFYRLGAARLERTICSPAKGYGWKAIMGSTLAPHPQEVKSSDLIILWGSNAAATNIHFLHYVLEAKKSGAVVWLIDTYETPTAAIADEVFLVRPSSDGALALGIMQVLANKALIDEDFLTAHVQGYEKLLQEILPQWTLEAAAEITGLPAAVIEKMACAYGRARAPFISIGSGLSRYGNGAMTVRTILCLPALTGAWTKTGGGATTGIPGSSALPMAQITREDLISTPTRIININQLGNALTSSHPPIKSLFVYHCNPAAVCPDQNRVMEGLEREDLFTVVHERFLTDTALYADIILPATSSLEHSDIYSAYGHYCLRRVQPAIEPIGQSRSNWEVFQLLAQKMGFEDSFFSRSADELIDSLIASSSGWLDNPAKERLAQGALVELPLPMDYKTKFKTPSGQIEIFNPLETEPLPKYLLPHGGELPLWLMTAPSVYGLNSSFLEREDLIDKRQTMNLFMNPKDASARKLNDRQTVIAHNSHGEVGFLLAVTPKVPSGVVVAEGVWDFNHSLNGRTVNSLVSPRLTDKAAGSTFYDTKVEVRSN